MALSTDRKYQRIVRHLLRAEFIGKKLPRVNDELDTAYEKMLSDIDKNIIWIMMSPLPIGYYYFKYVSQSLKGNFIGQASFYILSIAFVSTFVEINKRRVTNDFLENLMIERYEAQLLQNNPRIKEKYSNQNSQRKFNFENSQSAQVRIDQYQSDQKLNLEAHQSQNLQNQDANNHQIENLSLPRYLENKTFQNPQDLPYNQVAKRSESQFSDDSVHQNIDWRNQHSWSMEKSPIENLRNSSPSKYDSLDKRATSGYMNEWKNQNNYYPGIFNQDSASITYYPGVSSSHGSIPKSTY